MFEYWRTKDGKEIQVIDMETNHIKNCIKAIEDGQISFDGWFGSEENEKWLEIFENELKFRKYYRKED